MNSTQYAGNAAVWLLVVIPIVAGIIAVTGKDIEAISKSSASVIGVVVPTGTVVDTGENMSSVLKGFVLADTEDVKEDVVVEYLHISCEDVESSEVARFVETHSPYAFVILGCEYTEEELISVLSSYEIPIVSAFPHHGFIETTQEVFRVAPPTSALFSLLSLVLIQEKVKDVGIVSDSYILSQAEKNELLRSFEQSSTSLSFINLEQDASTSSTESVYTIFASSTFDSLVFVGAPQVDIARLEEISDISQIFFVHEIMHVPENVQDVSLFENSFAVTFTKGSNSFGERYRIAYNEPVGLYTPFGYDAYRVLAEAIRESHVFGTSTRVRLQDKVYFGASGKIDFTTDTHSRDALVLWKFTETGYMEILPEKYNIEGEGSLGRMRSTSTTKSLTSE